MSDKSYVTLEANVCIICGNKYETGSLLMDMKLRNRFGRTTITGSSPCPSCHEMMERGQYVALIGVNNRGNNPTLRPEDASRTGDLLWLKREAFNHIIVGVTIPEPPIVFIDQEGINKIKAMIPKEEKS